MELMLLLISFFTPTHAVQTTTIKATPAVSPKSCSGCQNGGKNGDMN
jgi:hypothetical protein